jgi:hypothetical protein
LRGGLEKGNLKRGYTLQEVGYYVDQRCAWGRFKLYYTRYLITTVIKIIIKDKLYMEYSNRNRGHYPYRR